VSHLLAAKPEKLQALANKNVMMLNRFSIYLLAMSCNVFAGAATAQTMSNANHPSGLAASFAPTGTLRASINLGNPILASRNADGQVTGVSVDLAQALALRLGLNASLVVFDSAGKSVDAVTNQQADIGFFAVDPVRGQGIAFTAPYVLIEGSYLVRQNSPLQSNSEVDRAGIRVAVGKGSAYDLYLTRELKNAQLHRAPTSPTTVDFFIQEHLEVAAGVKQQLEMDAQRIPGLRLLPGRFMVIEQAMGLAKDRSAAAQNFLWQFVEDMKANGMVAAALRKHRIEGAVVAPARQAP
jgi:polar amino acid transport system substrate-binding protein